MAPLSCNQHLHWRTSSWNLKILRTFFTYGNSSTISPISSQFLTLQLPNYRRLWISPSQRIESTPPSIRTSTLPKNLQMIPSKATLGTKDAPSRRSKSVVFIWLIRCTSHLSRPLQVTSIFWIVEESHHREEIMLIPEVEDHQQSWEVDSLPLRIMKMDFLYTQSWSLVKIQRTFGQKW